MDDAFGCVHRAHASVHGLAKLYRDRGCGFLLEKEIAALGKLVTDPDRPYVAVLGGAKVSDKIAVLDSLLEKVSARAHEIGDEDVARARASGMSEDEIFEVVVCAGVGRATRRHEAALSALRACTKAK